MASISNAAANLYNHTALTTGSNLVNDQKPSAQVGPSAVASAKLAVESTIVSIGNKNAGPALTYNASGRLDAGNQANAILQAQASMSDALNSLSNDSTSGSSSDIASILNISGTTTTRQ